MYQLDDDIFNDLIQAAELSSTTADQSSPPANTSQSDGTRFPLDTTAYNNESSADVSDTSFIGLLEEAVSHSTQGSESKREKKSQSANIVDNLMDTHFPSEPHPSPVVPAMFVCGLCGKTFTQNWILVKHYNTAHGLDGSTVKVCKCGKKIESNSKHTCHGCTYCVLKFPTKLALQDHILNHHTQVTKKCEICDESFTSQQMYTRHVIECRVKSGPSPKNEDIICDRCNRKLKSHQHLKKHETNFNSLSHMCPVCNTRFCIMKETFQHFKKEHQSHKRRAYLDSSFACPLCPEVKFVDYRKYAYHIMDVHETSPLLSKGQTVKSRNYSIGRVMRTKFMQEETEEWEFEGDYIPDEEVEQSDYVRTSSRIEVKYATKSCPTMLATKRKEGSVSPKLEERKSKKQHNVVLNP